MSRVLVELRAYFARVPRTIGCGFLDKTGADRNAAGRGFDQGLKLPKRDLPLLARTEIERVIVAHRDVPFTLPSLCGRAAIQLLDSTIEFLDLFFAGELSFFRRRPTPFVPARENQMRPILSLGLRDGEQLHARVRMIPRFVAARAETRGDLFEPAQEQDARKL